MNEDENQTKYTLLRQRWGTFILGSILFVCYGTTPMVSVPLHWVNSCRWIHDTDLWLPMWILPKCCKEKSTTRPKKLLQVNYWENRYYEPSEITTVRSTGRISYCTILLVFNKQKINALRHKKYLGLCTFLRDNES